MPETDYTPDMEEVGALVRARTKTGLGRELGTFADPSSEGARDGTRPTATEAGRLITQAVNDMRPIVGSEELPNDELKQAAQHLTALKAAMLVEVSYGSQNDTTFKDLKALYDDSMRQFKLDLSGEEGGDTEGGGPMPHYGFPDDAGGMVGWGTRW